MKSGVTLQQMLTEVKRQSESKEDYLIAPNRLRMESYGKEMFLHLSDDSGTELIEPMTITGIAHRQIGTHLRIPAAYYDRMREERPDLLAYNANTWFKQENSQRMLRTLDGSARAYLSNRYRRIDALHNADYSWAVPTSVFPCKMGWCVCDGAVGHAGRPYRQTRCGRLGWRLGPALGNVRHSCCNPCHKSLERCKICEYGEPAADQRAAGELPESFLVW